MACTSINSSKLSKYQGFEYGLADNDDQPTPIIWKKVINMIIFKATNLTKTIICFGNWYIALKWWNKGKYYTLNSLSFHFSPFENENYHRFIISLQANNLTSLSPYATDLTSDREKRIICILSLINCKLAWFFVRN